MNNEYHWLVQTLGYWSVAFLLIPRKTMLKLLPFGFISGFLYTIAVQAMAVWVFKKWIFTPDILTIRGIPFFFLMAWYGVTISYGYLLLKYPRYQYWLVLIFSGIGTLINQFGIYFKMLTMRQWNLVDTFMFAIFSHVLILYFLKFWSHKEILGA
jgi:hypothetical protein